MTEVTAMQAKTNERQSGDTDNRFGRIVGVEDADGKAWCFECAHAEIRQAGDAAFMVDLYAGESARRKCVNCKRPIGEVQG